jgi:SAM-dependent methyltransferase
MSHYSYVGDDLHMFAGATTWKAYFGHRVRRHLRGDVLEVGAGIGSMTRALCSRRQRSWLCLEPDATLADRLRAAAARRRFPIPVEVRTATSGELGAAERFDTIIYADVLEHLEDDRHELEVAASHLRPGGHVIVLCPAHQFLFSEFDKAIGHYRRYDADMYRALRPVGLTLRRVFYLDAAGMALSMANRLVLKESAPTPKQIKFWDRVVVPMSKVIDPMLGRRVGKSVVGIWRAA